MIRELFISIYLFFYKCCFAIFKLLPLKNKVVIVASFLDNNQYLYAEMKKRQFPGEIVFLCKKSCASSIKKVVSEPIYQIESGIIWAEIMAAYHMMTSKTIIVDNYYGFLAAANFRDGVECIQIWHAAGAIKNFGLLDQTVEKRSDREKKRLLSVYGNFHKVVVNSRTFAQIFEKAFHIKDHQFLPFGYPRTDFFFDNESKENLRLFFYEKYPQFKGKKIILYAPTYRAKEENNGLMLDIPLLSERLKEKYIFIIKMHPSISMQLELEEAEFITDFSKEASINELLVVSDFLITDYSSIPFEYVLMNKPMIFYPYDLSEYEKNPGLWEHYENIVPGPIAKNTEEVINYIKSFPYESVDYEAFNLKWNEYSNGLSSQKLVQYIINRHLTENNN